MVAAGMPPPNIASSEAIPVDRRVLGGGSRRVGSASTELDPWEDGEAVAGDAKRVLALEEVAAADLVDHDAALVADAVEPLPHSISPSTIVCSGADVAPATVVSRNMVQLVAEASV